MYRPSPQIPSPSLDAAHKCYAAAIFNIQLQKRQVEANLIDITWIFTQAIFMALNTVLWCLSYPGIRQQHPIEEVQLHIQDALRAIELCADRWPGVRSAEQLYENLVLGCLKAYETDKISESPAASDYVSTATQDISSSTSQYANSPASTANTSLYGAQSPQSIHSVQIQAGGHNFQRPGSGFLDHTKQAYHPQPDIVTPTSQPQNLGTQYMPSTVPRLDIQSMHYSLPGFDPQNAVNYIPTTSSGSSPWTSGPMLPGIIPGLTGSPNMNYDELPYLAPFGQEYSRYMQQSYPSTFQMQSLSQQQQMELMASLESSQLPDVSNLVSDATTFYTAQLP
jgi:hypothetical protein